MERLIRDRRFDSHPFYAHPVSRWPGYAGFLAVFSIPITLSAILSSSVVTGNVSEPVAAQNRAIIEGSAAADLPLAGVVNLDRALQLANNQTIVGGTLKNAYTDSGAYCRTLLCDPAVGWNYFDSGTPVSANRFKLIDPSAAPNYHAGAPAYLWRLNGFGDGVGQLRTLHGVRAVTSNIVTYYGPPLDPRLTASRWYSNAVVVGNVSRGDSSVQSAQATFSLGDWVLLTEGPSVGNADRCEWHRVTGIAGGTVKTVMLDTPAQRSYNAALLAKAAPTYGVTLRNVTLQNPVGTNEAALVKNAVNWRWDGCDIQGIFAPVSNAFGTFTSCKFAAGSYMNSCHDMTFIGCQFTDFRMEECCFNCRFEGCTFIGSFGCSFKCERLSFRGCRLTGPMAYMGLDASDSVIDALTCDEASFFVALQGDRWKVSNVSAACPIMPQQGAVFLLSNVRAPSIPLGYSTWPSSGTVIDSPNTSVQAGSWAIIP